jgi:hypothetical protein
MNPDKSRPLLSLTSDPEISAFIANYTKAPAFITIPLDFIGILRDWSQYFPGIPPLTLILSPSGEHCSLIRSIMYLFNGTSQSQRRGEAKCPQNTDSKYIVIYGDPAKRRHLVAENTLCHSLMMPHKKCNFTFWRQSQRSSWCTKDLRPGWGLGCWDQ